MNRARQTTQVHKYMKYEPVMHAMKEKSEKRAKSEGI